MYERKALSLTEIPNVTGSNLHNEEAAHGKSDPASSKNNPSEVVQILVTVSFILDKQKIYREVCC